MDGKHSMRLQNVNVYVWTGPEPTGRLGSDQFPVVKVPPIIFKSMISKQSYNDI